MKDLEILYNEAVNVEILIKKMEDEFNAKKSVIQNELLERIKTFDTALQLDLATEFVDSKYHVVSFRYSLETRLTNDYIGKLRKGVK